MDGREVLELGCGRGELSLELLRRGARLTAVDLSPAMVELAWERAALFRPERQARFEVAPVEDTGLDEGTFELAVGKWVLHHADVPRAARELARVLRQGGRAVFYENQARNPLLPLARRLLPRSQRVGTSDELALDEGDFAALLDAFGSVERSYPSLYLFEALSRALGHRAYRQLRGMDRSLERVAVARRFGWHVLITVERVV